MTEILFLVRHGEVLGARPGHETLPISIFIDWEGGEMAHAATAVWALTGVSLAVILLYNRWPWTSRA